MKRKLPTIFLAAITAVCFCIGASACEILDELTDSSSSTSSSSSASSSSTSSSSTSSSSSTNSTSSSSSSSTSSSSSSSSSSSGAEEGGEVAADFTPREGNGSYGYYSLASKTNGEAMQKMYYEMYTACEEFTESTEDVASTDDEYIISRISYSALSLTKDEAVTVWEIFQLENPMYYWLSNSYLYTTSSLCLCIDETYADYSVRASYNDAVASMVDEAREAVSGQSTELGKAMAVHDYIIGKIDYAYQSDNVTPETAIWAHNITGVSSMGYGVCEAYSKTCLALCLINGLNCTIVSGTANNGDHAWNIIEIDGVWYGVDCTWDDTGTEDLSYSYFGMNASKLSSTRTTNDIFTPPEIADRGIQLVTLFKGESELGMYINIDAAFEAMTDATADYTIELYFTNPAGATVYTSPSVTMYIYSESTPAVNSITINGVLTKLEGGYFYVSYLNIDSKFTLDCNLQINDFITYTEELDLGSYTLTTGGYYCRLSGYIYDGKTTDDISIQSETSYITDIYATINVTNCYGAAAINVYGTATIDKYIAAAAESYYYIYVQKKAALTVNNLVYENGTTASKAIYIMLYFDSVDTYPALYLGDVDMSVCLFMYGTLTTTDAEGNTVSTYVTPTDLTDCVIATLGSADDFSGIRVYFNTDSGNVNRTSLYSVNSENQIVYSGN